MAGFYNKKENLVIALTNWLAIFSEGNAPNVPVVRDEHGIIDLTAVFDLPCYKNFPESEKTIWQESWFEAT